MTDDPPERPAPWRTNSVLDLSNPYRREGYGPILAPLGRYRIEFDAIAPVDGGRRVVAALVNAAPEMEALLLRMRRMLENGVSETSWEFWRRDMEMVLCQIEQARAGG